MSMVIRILLVLIPLLSLSCGQDQVKKIVKGEITVAAASIDDLLADSLGAFFQNEYYADDLQFLVKDSTSYEFYKIDLNNDGKKEIFVRLFGNYFCGTGGCNYLILDQAFEVVNKFTTTNAPIIATQEFQNEWRVLVTEIDKVQKMLININGNYPSNPAMAPNSNIPISRDDIRMFDDLENPSKRYYF